MATHHLSGCADGLCATPEARGADRPVQSIPSALVSAVDAGLGLLVDTLFTWQRRKADRRRLMGLDDHMLRDIGLSRADIEAEATKPFWRS